MGSIMVEAMGSICTWVVTVGGGMGLDPVDTRNLIGSICIDLSHQDNPEHFSLIDPSEYGVSHSLYPWTPCLWIHGWTRSKLGIRPRREDAFQGYLFSAFSIT